MSVAWDFDSDARRPAAIEEGLDLARNAAVVRAFVVRDLKVRYKRSIFGAAWSLASPLAMMIVLTIVFSHAFAQTAPAFPAFVLPALLLWNFFAQTITGIVTEVAAGSDLWRRVRVPKSASALATTITGVVHLAIAVAALIPILAVLHRPLGWPLLTLPLVIAATAIFALGVSLLAASVALYFPDVAHMVQVLVPVWMFATPVVYPLAILPERFRRLVEWNPMTLMVGAFRDPLYANRAASLETFVLMFAIGIAVLAIGWIAFSRGADDVPYRG